MIVPDSMSPKDKISCNQFESVWSFSIQFDKQVYITILIVIVEHSTKLLQNLVQVLCTMVIKFIIIYMQFIRPTKDSFIRIFSAEGEEVLAINVKTSAAVMYPSNDKGQKARSQCVRYSEVPLYFLMQVT